MENNLEIIESQYEFNLFSNKKKDQNHFKRTKIFQISKQI